MNQIENNNLDNNEVVDYYDHIAPKYDASRFDNSYGKFIHKQEIAFFNNYIGKSQLDSHLDLGCGTGRFMEYALHGVDPSAKMLDIAQQKYPDKIFKVASGAATGFAAASFKKVYAFHVMMHVKKSLVLEIIKESHRILEPQGKLIFDFPSQKRRELLNYKAANWHGASSFNCADIKKMAGTDFKVSYSRGFLFLPIHLIPVRIRFWFYGLDQLLCRSFLKSYSSYIAVILEKR